MSHSQQFGPMDGGGCCCRSIWEAKIQDPNNSVLFKYLLWFTMSPSSGIRVIGHWKTGVVVGYLKQKSRRFACNNYQEIHKNLEDSWNSSRVGWYSFLIKYKPFFYILLYKLMSKVPEKARIVW